MRCCAGDPASWLNNANMAMFSSKNNASTSETTFVFATNGAPQVWLQDASHGTMHMQAFKSMELVRPACACACMQQGA